MPGALVLMLAVAFQSPGCADDSRAMPAEAATASGVGGTIAGTSDSMAGGAPAAGSGGMPALGASGASGRASSAAGASGARSATARVNAAGTSGVSGAGAAGSAGAAAGASGAAGATPPSSAGADFVEDHRDACTIPSFPAANALKEIAPLPDPFTTLSGMPVTTKAQWTCRREEIAAMIEHYELGEKPRHPEKVSGAVSGNTLTVMVSDKGKSVSFTVAIKKPAGAGPFPAIIGYGSVNLGSALSGLDVATINYTAADIFNASAGNQIAKDGSSYRGQGIFYDLYGRDHSAGTLIAWAWGVSRIIDALAATSDAGIDPKRIAVTGCSRFGKGAVVAGAYDERVALTIPQESGSGGCSAWRGIAQQKSLGKDIEQLSNVAGGTNWFRTSFSTSFTDGTVNKIPYDHHQLVGMVAPRGLLNIEQDGIAWLGPGASHINNVGTRELFVALGAEEAHTYSLSTGHDHCVLPSTQNHWVQSYVKKYLLGQAGEAAKIETPSGYTFDKAKWIDWTTPSLR